jgi:hypothetical protein
MKRKLVSPPRLLDRGSVFYPVLPRHIPVHHSRLEPLAHQLSALRAEGRTIAQLRSWVHAKTGWRPGDRAVYRQLAKLPESSK